MSYLKENIRTLLVATQSGDQRSYQELLRLLYPYVEKIVSRKVHKQDDIYDVTQEVLISIHNSLNSYDPDRQAMPWINTIIQRRVIDYVRKITRISDNETTTSDGDVTFLRAPANFLTEDLEWIEELPEDLKQAVVLTKIEGHSTTEAAEIVGIKPDALRTRVSRGIRKLKKILIAEREEQ
jgi:RNA polymerase sigma factor (sigma-70 family)